MEKANWKLWTDYVQTGIGEIDLNDNNSTTQWKTFLNLLLDASEEKYIPLKTIYRHSKPFWNSELTESSEELRHLRRKFKHCSNYINVEKLARAKENFKKQLSDSASEWMSCFLSNLGHKRGRDFWASYKSLLNKKKEEVGLIRNKTGELLYTKSEICTQFETTFFSGQQLSKQSYDEGFVEHVENEVIDFGKLIERILAGRINKYLDLHNIIGQAQEGFRTKRNSVRSLYRLHLLLARANVSIFPTASLNIDLEKAFDSVWKSGLLYKLRNYNIADRMFRIIEVFLRT